jgi:hypothetical protein
VNLEIRQGTTPSLSAPTGLAVGLALKECATPEVRRFAPRGLAAPMGPPLSGAVGDRRLGWAFMSAEKTTRHARRRCHATVIRRPDASGCRSGSRTRVGPSRAGRAPPQSGGAAAAGLADPIGFVDRQRRELLIGLGQAQRAALSELDGSVAALLLKAWC